MRRQDWKRCDAPEFCRQTPDLRHAVSRRAGSTDEAGTYDRDLISDSLRRQLGVPIVSAQQEQLKEFEKQRKANSYVAQQLDLVSSHRVQLIARNTFRYTEISRRFAEVISLIAVSCPRARFLLTSIPPCPRCGRSAQGLPSPSNDRAIREPVRRWELSFDDRCPPFEINSARNPARRGLL